MATLDYITISDDDEVLITGEREPEHEPAIDLIDDEPWQLPMEPMFPVDTDTTDSINRSNIRNYNDPRRVFPCPRYAGKVDLPPTWEWDDFSLYEAFTNPLLIGRFSPADIMGLFELDHDEYSDYYAWSISIPVEPVEPPVFETYSLPPASPAAWTYDDNNSADDTFVIEETHTSHEIYKSLCYSIDQGDEQTGTFLPAAKEARTSSSDDENDTAESQNIVEHAHLLLSPMRDQYVVRTLRNNKEH